MQPDLKDRIKASAESNNRSMNAEIVATLEEKYPAPIARGISAADFYKLAKDLAEDDSEEGWRRFEEAIGEYGGKVERSRDGSLDIKFTGS